MKNLWISFLPETTSALISNITAKGGGIPWYPCFYARLTCIIFLVVSFLFKWHKYVQCCYMCSTRHVKLHLKQLRAQFKWSIGHLTLIHPFRTYLQPANLISWFSSALFSSYCIVASIRGLIFCIILVAIRYALTMSFPSTLILPVEIPFSLLYCFLPHWNMCKRERKCGCDFFKTRLYALLAFRFLDMKGLVRRIFYSWAAQGLLLSLLEFLPVAPPSFLLVNMHS